LHPAEEDRDDATGDDGVGVVFHTIGNGVEILALLFLFRKFCYRRFPDEAT
jgi:hypothetical protein